MLSDYSPCAPRRQTPLCDVKIPPFTGKEDWAVWINRFEVLADRYRWGEEEMIDQLLPKLQGSAGEFVFTQLPRGTLHNYNRLTTELNSQFRVVETQRSFAAKFSRRDQRNGETAEEYAADLKRLYAKAYGRRNETIRQEDLVRRFLDGLRDSEVRFEVEYHKDPQNIDEAVFHVVRFIQTRQGRDRDPYGEKKMRKLTRQVLDEDRIENVGEYDLLDNEDIRACKGKTRPERLPTTESDMPNQCKERDRDMHSMMLEILEKLKQTNHW